MRTHPFLQEACGNGLNFRDGGGGNVVDCELEKDGANNITLVDPDLVDTSYWSGILGVGEQGITQQYSEVSVLSGLHDILAPDIFTFLSC